MVRENHVESMPASLMRSPLRDERRADSQGSPGFGVLSDAVPTARALRDLECRTLADVDTAGRCLAILAKVLLAARRLALEDVEVFHVLSQRADFGPRSLNELPTASAPVDGAAVDRLRHLAGLAALGQAAPQPGAAAGAWMALVAGARVVVEDAALTDAQATARAITAYVGQLADALGISAEMVRSTMVMLRWDQPANIGVAAVPAGKQVTFNRLVTVSGLVRFMDCCA